MLPSNVRLAWLAGIIDGEGTVRMYRCHDKRNGHSYIKADVRITNTNAAIIVESVATLRAITGCDDDVSVYPSVTPKNKKDCFHVQIRRREAIAKILEAIIPYLIGKKEQARIVLEWVTHRLVVQPNKGGVTIPLNNIDWSLLDRCRSAIK